MCFFCETVSALLRHPYICTHRCAFNADIIYVYIIFGPLKSFTNSSRWAFIYPCPATTPPNLEMHLFQLPQLLRSWSKSGDFLLRRGGNSLPERLDLWDEFHDSFEWFKTRTTTGLSIFLRGINYGSGGNGHWFPARLLPLYKTWHFKLAWRGEEGYVGSQLFSWTVEATQVLLGVKGACRDYQYMADSFIPQILNS